MLEISKIHFPSELTGYSNTTIYITNHYENDVIMKLRCNEPKRYHISRSEFSPTDDIFLLNKGVTISINVSVNLSRVPPTEKDRADGSISDRFQILYKEIPPLDSSQLSNLKELWEGIRKTGKPLEVIANCTVDLPLKTAHNNTQSNSTQSITINPKPINSNSTNSKIESTSNSTFINTNPEISSTQMRVKHADKSTPEIPFILNNQPITNSSISLKSQQHPKSKTLARNTTPFQKFKENLPVFIQEFRLSDYEDVHVLSWKGFLVIFIAFLIGKFFG